MTAAKLRQTNNINKKQTEEERQRKMQPNSHKHHLYGKQQKHKVNSNPFLILLPWIEVGNSHKPKRISESIIVNKRKDN